MSLRYIFLNADWLSCNHGDGLTSRILTEINYDPKVTKYLSDQQRVFHRHLVLSLFRKNSTSRYTRIQRVAVLCAMFFLMMVSSAMWHGTEEKSTVTFKFKVGPFSMGWNEFYVGCMTILTVYPVVLLISELFRRSKKKEQPEDDKPEQIQNISEEKRDIIIEKKRQAEQIFRWLNEGIEKEYPRCLLPVAWILVFVTIVTSSFFTFLYSLEWGGDKSNEWLGAFFLSSVQALLFLDPLLVSLILACLGDTFEITQRKLIKFRNDCKGEGKEEVP